MLATPVYNAMIAVANVPEYDRFQVVTRHEPDEIIYPEQGYLASTTRRT